MKFAKVLFMFAGILGIIVVVPMFFLEERVGSDFPPPVSHPEYYFGFLCVVLSWQVGFLVIASDPKRFRMMMVPAILEKGLYGIAAILLFVQSRIPEVVFWSALGDLVLGVLFAAAFVRTGGVARESS